MFTVRAIARALALVAGLAVTGLATTPAAQATPRASIVLDPGDPIYSDAGACDVGAYVTDGSAHYILTAAACAQYGDTWYADASHEVVVGTTAGGGFQGQGTLIAPVAGVTSQQDFTSAAGAFVGESVCVRAGTTAVHCGTVTAVNVTVTTPEGTLQHLIQTNVCTESGVPFLGAPLFTGGTVLGIQLFGNGSCASGGQSFFEPIIDILDSDGLSLY